MLSRKIKNRLYLIEEKEKLSYWLDLNTGKFYNHNDLPIDCVPSLFQKLTPTFAKTSFDNNELLYNVWEYSGLLWQLNEKQRAIFCSYMERFASLHITFKFDERIDTDEEGKEFPDLPNFCALFYILQHTPVTYFAGKDTISMREIETAYVMDVLVPDLQKSFPKNYYTLIRKIAGQWSLIGQSRSTYVSIIRCLGHEKLYLLEKDFMDALINEWMKVKRMAGEPYDKCPSHGFLIELEQTKKRAKAIETRAMDKELQRNNLPYLYFEDETFMCRPLLTCAQFHDEATQQNNCVERLYLKRVAKGYTHIVSIRHKASPDTSCITCEINNDYEIVQYLRANNNTELEKDEEDFYKKLKAHLQEAKRHDPKFDGTAENTHMWSRGARRLANLIE